MRYPIELVHEEDGTVSVYVPDVPGALSFGADEAEARVRIVDALESMIGALMVTKEDIPPPSKAARRPTITVPALTVAKIGLYQAMREAGIGKAELARRLGLHPPQVDRILDPRHNSHLAAVEAALAVLGRELSVTVKAA